MVKAKKFEHFVVVGLGQGNGDAAVVVFDQLLAEEDERLCWRYDADMFQVKMEESCWMKLLDASGLPMIMKSST